MDPVSEWRFFVTTATLRSFSATAHKLGRSPQTVTRAIADLERRLGTRLLHRTTRSVSLTADGARYLERGRQVLADFDALETLKEPAELRGTLTVAAPVMFGQLHVLPVVADFLSTNPGLDVRLELFDRVVSLATEGADVAVRIGALPDSALRARPVGTVEAVTVASPAYLARRGRPRVPADLERHDCIAFSATTPIAEHWSWPSEQGRERVVRVRPRLAVNTAQAAIDAALADLGIVRVLSYQVVALVRSGALVAVLASHRGPPIPVQIVQLPGVPLRAATRFAEHAAAALTVRLRRRR